MPSIQLMRQWIMLILLFTIVVRNCTCYIYTGGKTVNTFSKAEYIENMQKYLNEKRLLAKTNPEQARKESIETLIKMGLIDKDKYKK